MTVVFDISPSPVDALTHSKNPNQLPLVSALSVSLPLLLKFPAAWKVEKEEEEGEPDSAHDVSAGFKALPGTRIVTS